jgi:hypothetical protein
MGAVVSRPAHLPPGIETAVPSRTFDGSHDRSARFGQEINLLSQWGIEPRFLGRAARSIFTIAIEGFRLPRVVPYDCNSSVLHYNDKTKTAQISVTNFIHYTNIMFVIPHCLKYSLYPLCCRSRNKSLFMKYISHKGQWTL